MKVESTLSMTRILDTGEELETIDELIYDYCDSLDELHEQLTTKLIHNYTVVEETEAHRTYERSYTLTDADCFDRVTVSLDK